MIEPWQINSWKNFQAKQQPFYSDQESLETILKHLSSCEEIVKLDEILKLRSLLLEAEEGKVFVLQAGDCAERFIDSNKESLTSKVKALEHMKLILQSGLQKPVLGIGRIAGQYAKPRSSIFEETPQGRIYNYRGDNINSFDPNDRKAHPKKLEQGYKLAKQSYGLIQDILNNICPQQEAQSVEELLGTYQQQNDLTLWEHEAPQLFTSHEALHLSLESALTRRNHSDGLWYNSGAHTLWVGERTRFPESAHIEYARGIENPIGIKISHDTCPKEVPQLVKKLNPKNNKGKTILITRLGAEKVAETLPSIVESVKQEGLNVLWMCDPMHGNSYITNSGFKTRSFSKIVLELQETFNVHQELGTVLGGIHLETAGQRVTECIGGTFENVSYNDLKEKYETQCDPRLNYLQSLELALEFCKIYKNESSSFQVNGFLQASGSRQISPLRSSSIRSFPSSLKM